jgi:hypothetical protein
MCKILEKYTIQYVINFITKSAIFNFKILRWDSILWYLGRKYIIKNYEFMAVNSLKYKLWAFFFQSIVNSK